jgi:hypothetical protein
VGYHYLRLVVVAPTVGALNEVVTVNGTPLSSFVRTSGDTMTSGLTLTGVNGYVHASSTITAPQFTGALVGNVTGGISGGAASVTTLAASGAANITGELTWGAAATKSTATVLGALTIPAGFQAASVLAGGAVTGATINISGSGQLLMGNATAAELADLVPGQAHGAQIYNSTDDTVCYSSAAAAGSWILPRGPAKDSAMVSCY